MPTIINPSTLASIIKYLQSVALTLGIPANKLPEKLTDFAESINNFFNKIWDYIPHMPDFDVRVRIIVLSFAIPALLDLLFAWFTSSLLDNIFHLLDIAAAFALLFEIAYVSMSKGKTTLSVFIGIPVCALYFIFRIVRFCLIKRQKPEEENTESIKSIVDRIKNYYMKGIIPGVDSDDNEEDMEKMLELYNESYVFKIVKPSVLNISFILISMAILSIIIAYSFDAFGPLQIKPFIRISITIICSIMLIMLLIVFIMIIFPCLREPFVSFRTFVRRYGVKLLLLIIDFLYIPIGTAILEIFRYEENSCGNGFYRSYSIDTSSFFNFFLDHETTCQPCSFISNVTTTANLFSLSENLPTGISDKCLNSCFNNTIKYSIPSPHLEFYYDILPTILPIVAFSFFAIIIGQPVLTLYVVLNNKQIAWSIPVFGNTAEIKWSTLVSKLTTTGIFNFYMFKYNLSGWAIFTSIQKLLFIVLTEIAERVNLHVSYGILGLYITLFICYVYFRPFTFLFNNVLEIIMAFANACLTIIPICSIYSKQVPNWFSIPLSVIICAIPIIAIPYAFCRKSEIKPELDPGTNLDENGKPVEPDDPNQQVYLHIIDLIAIWEAVDLENSGTTIYPESYDDDFDPNFCVCSEEENYIIIGRQDLLDKMNAMYSLIDKVCDAATTTSFLTMIKIAVTISAACSGWFFGSIIGRKSIFNTVVC